MLMQVIIYFGRALSNTRVNVRRKSFLLFALTVMNPTLFRRGSMSREMESLKQELEHLQQPNQENFFKKKLKELEGKLREKNEKLKSANVDMQELRKELKRFKAGVKDEGYIFVLETYVKELGLWANFKAWLHKNKKNHH